MMKSVFTTLCILVNALVSAQTETYTWKNVPIGGGGFVSGIVMSKTEQNLMYARTDVGGAYRWNAADNTWIPLLDWVSENEVGYLGVESIAIDPVETSNVYMLAGTSYFSNGKTAILRSNDYGSTFNVVDVTAQFKAHGNGMGRQTGEKLQVDPNDPSVLYCGTRSNGLFKSTNGGLIWTRMTGLNITNTTSGNGLSFVILDPSTGSSGNATQTIITGITQTGSNIYRSDDGGVNFTSVTGGPTNLMPQRAALTSDRKLYVTYANNAGPWDINQPGVIYRYDLASGTWTNVTPTGFSGAFGGISADPDNSQRLLASSLNTYQAQDGSWGDRIFLSTNGGTSWTDVVARGFDLQENGSPWISGHAIHWAGCIEFDPFDTRKAWVISGNGVFSTEDVDATTNVWKFNVKGLEETVPLDIVSIPNGPLVSVIGDYDGFRHTDLNTYAPIHQPRMGSTHGVAYASLNPNVMLRIGDTKMFYSEDMGLTWTECSRTGTKGSVALSADGKIFFYSPESSGKTYRSADKGTTWTEATGLNINWARITADYINPKVFYVYNPANGNFLLSNDGGITFSQKTSPGSGGSKVIRVVPGKEGEVWVPLYNGGLSRTTNSGTAFNKITNVTSCGAVGFGKPAPGKTFPTVYIWGTVGGALGVYRSVDEGASWKRVNDGLHEYGGPANGQFVIGDMNVYGRVYMSTAGRGIVYGESDLTCEPTPITPKVKIGEEPPKQTAFVEMNAGQVLRLSPEADEGTWLWSGPNGFTSSDREVVFPSVASEQRGVYTATFVNTSGCISAAQQFLINVVVQPQSIAIKTPDDVETINTLDGTLQLTAEFSPAGTTDKSVVWSIEEGQAFAELSSDGLLTAIDDGAVKVRATSQASPSIFGEKVIEITNQNITSVEEEENVITFYPNPVRNILQVNATAKISMLEFISIDGKSILVVHVPPGENQFDVTQLSAGVYIMKIIHAEKSYFRRLVKL